MPLQADLIFSENQALSGASPIVSTNVIEFPDLENAFGDVITPDEGGSARIYIVVIITEDLVGAGAAISAYYSTKETDADLTTSIGATRLFFPALSPAGTKRVTPLPFGELQKYQGMLYTPEAALTSGKITAYLSIDQETPTA